MKYRFYAAAEDDVTAAVLWYDEQGPGLAQAFLQEIERKLRRIGEHPLAYARVKGDFRRAPLDRFPYNVIYRIIQDIVEVAAVCHSRRDPNVWRGRLS